MTTPSWDAAYAGGVSPAWDVGEPQPAFVRLAERGLLTGQVLDAGYGTGEQTLLAASSGADALGLADLDLGFDTIIDSGLFYVFDDESRARYVTSLASVLRPGGRLYLMCFGDRQPGTFGPRRVGQDELRAAFSDGWTVIEIQAETFAVNRAAFGIATAQAWLATISRDGLVPR